MNFQIFSSSARLAVAGAAALAVLAGCQTAPQAPSGQPSSPQKPQPLPGTAAPQFSRAQFSSLPVSSEADWENARKAFRNSCSSRSFASAAVWKNACAAAAATGSASQFFTRNFTLWQVMSVQSVDGTPIESTDTGLMTGYYEPELQASAVRSAAYPWPVLATPSDLIEVDLASLYPELKGKRVRGKLSGRKLIPYDDRSAIDRRTDLYPNAIAWLADPVDQLFLQIQGSGRLRIKGKGTVRVSYDNQNGHPYKAVANWLIREKQMTASEASMQSIRAWAKANPARVPELLASNPSYVFFKKAPVSDLAAGPRGAQGVPLTPGASVAVDRRYWKMGAPFFVSIRQNQPDLAFSRPVIAQDTGGAIRGVIRFDYFWGSGDAAGEAAGRQKSEARAWLLVPNGRQPEELMNR